MSWFVEIPVAGVDPSLPGLYEWRIEDVGCYIGQYTRAKRPRNDYALNVNRILESQPYRKNNHDGFRTVHRELAMAKQERKTVTLSLIENVIGEIERNRRKQELIAQRRREALQGGLPVLNASNRRRNPR